jgi:D-sedoheptulose 7-phosphate isomerase
MSRSAVFLDRDGVINTYVYEREFGTVDSPARPEEFALTPGAGEAIAALNETGMLVVVVSNQPGVAKGRFSPTLLDAMTSKMKDLVNRGGGHLDAIYYCPHHPEGSVDAYRLACDCRKPNPGLFFQAAKEWQIDLGRSFTVGDGVVDVLAGRQAGTKTVFIGPRRGYVFAELERHDAWPSSIVGDLGEAVALIRSSQNGHKTRSNGKRLASAASRKPMSYTAQYVEEAREILNLMDQNSVEQMADLLFELRERRGRLFLLGVGGGAGHASHAVCDFRKIVGIEAYAPSDNASELTARINDEGWDTCYANWLRGSRLNGDDMILVFSVGGGDAKRNVSVNLVRALEYARQVGAKICGVVGRDGGFTRQVADACAVVPTINSATVTPHTESFQALIWHLLVSHPKLKCAEMKWESIECHATA